MQQVTPSDDIADKRRSPRIATRNMVTYVLFDENKRKMGSGKAFTLNLSQNGTLIQTQERVDGTFIILMTLDINGNQIKVKGHVTNSRVCEKTGNYLTGIEFIGPRDKQIKAIVAFVKAYQRQKYSEEIDLADLCQ